MRIGDLTEQALMERLEGTGLVMAIGPFTYELRIAWRPLARQVARIYAHHPMVENAPLTDYRIALRPTGRWWRWYRRQLRVTIDDDAPFLPGAVHLAYPMLESALNWSTGTAVARFLVIHAGGVERDGVAIVLPGHSGSGKSTLTAALMARGWRLLSDELVLIAPDSGLIQPFPKAISLKNDAIDVVDALWSEAVWSERTEGTTKGTVAFLRPSRASVEAAFETLAPRIIALPRFEAGATLAIEPLSKPEAFMALTEQSPNYRAMLETGFETMAALVDRCDHYTLRFGNTEDAVQTIERLATEAACDTKAA